jgi:KRAB domain-containing zinc finger protein
MSPNDASALAMVSKTNKRKGVPQKKPDEYPCPEPQCEEAFNTIMLLDKHVSKDHKGYRCGVGGCNERYRDRRDIEDHRVTGHSAFRFPCEVPDCQETFMLRTLAAHHRRLVHKISRVKEYVCTEGCSATFKLKPEYHKHVIDVHGGYACTVEGCGRSFLNSAEYRDEHVKGHTNAKSFSCTYDGCDAGFDHPYALSFHIKVIHENGKKHICVEEGCGKVFVSPSKRDLHYLVDHLNYRFRCEICGKQYKNVGNLNHHVNYSHKGITHDCTFEGCDASFQTNHVLRDHVLKDHLGELEFRCDRCEALFSTKANLQRHVNERCNGVLRGPQKCNICQVECRTFYFLQQHLLSHSQDRACLCSLCGVYFRDWAGLYTHVKNVHHHDDPIQALINVAAEGYDVPLVDIESYYYGLRSNDSIPEERLRDD